MDAKREKKQLFLSMNILSTKKTKQGRANGSMVYPSPPFDFLRLIPLHLLSFVWHHLPSEDERK
jgi:hypothetical protein